MSPPSVMAERKEKMNRQFEGKATAKDLQAEINSMPGGATATTTPAPAPTTTTTCAPSSTTTTSTTTSTTTTTTPSNETPAGPSPWTKDEIDAWDKGPDGKGAPWTKEDWNKVTFFSFFVFFVFCF